LPACKHDELSKWYTSLSTRKDQLASVHALLEHRSSCLSREYETHTSRRSWLTHTSQSQQWTGPLSRELLVFNSFVRSLSRSLRHLFEAVCEHLLLRGDARRAREDFIDIALSKSSSSV
jgi:hypothetical protein